MESQLSDEDGLIIAYLLDPAGKASRLDWDGIRRWDPKQGILWVHLNYMVDSTRHWLKEESDLAPFVVNELLSEDNRPHTFSTLTGIFVALRSINLNPGAEPEDLVGLRIWIESARVITTRNRKVIVLDEILSSFERGVIPQTSGELLAEMASVLNARIADVVDNVEDNIDKLEEYMIEDGDCYRLRSKIAGVRRDIILLRRYLAPQRETLARLQLEKATWLNEHDRQVLREVGYQTVRYVEDLDAAKDRSTILQDELTNQIAEKMNNNVYVLTLMAALFLPVNFLTSLWGTNVGGIPLNTNSHGFMWLVVSLVIIVYFEWFFFKKKKLL